MEADCACEVGSHFVLSVRCFLQPPSSSPRLTPKIELYVSMPAQNDLGCLRIWSIESYNEINNSRRAFLEDLVGDPPPPKTTDWHKITECIHVGSGFALTAVSPSFTVSLRFNTADVSDGWYRITYQNHREPEETGRISKVAVVQEHGGFLGPSRKAIAHFPYKFEMITIGNDRGHTRRAWVVGLANILTPREASENEPQTV